jgi:hypothetical protein
MGTDPAAGGARAGGHGAREGGGLLDRAAHRHWSALATAAGVPLESLRDSSGRPVVPAVVSAVVDGPVASLAGADPPCVMDVAPQAANGWRSVDMATTEHGERLRIELLSAFASFGDPAARRFESALVPAGLRPQRRGAAALRSRELRARWRSSIATAETSPPPVLAEQSLAAAWRWHGLAVASLGQLVTALDAAARLALPAPASAWEAVHREAHLCGLVADGDALTLASEFVVPLRFGATAPARDLVTFDVLRRRSDGAIVAVGHARFAPR